MPELKRTALITYNVHARGRTARGADRKFDLPALQRLINGPAVQERVRKGDMLGYYGHWPRVKFGMATQEGGVLDGQVVSLPTAVRTVHMSCDADGNITHQEEFLDTPAGQIAAKLYDSSAGGFSSAIDPVPGTFPYVPADFHGFDYVLEPNYDSNRGYRGIMDSVAQGGAEREEALALLDAAVGESFAAASLLNGMLDATSSQLRMALETLDRVSRENDLLIGRLAAGQTAAVLDDVMSAARQAPHRGGRRADTLQRIASFRDMPLVGLQALASDDDGKRGPEVEAAERRFGIAPGAL